MKFKLIFLVSVALLCSCMTSNPKLFFKSNSHQAVLGKHHVVAAEIGKDVVGNTRVIISISSDGLNIINRFLAQNMNEEMDIMFGDQIISKSVPIRTDHFLEDIIIPFQDEKLAKKFYSEFSQAPVSKN